MLKWLGLLGLCLLAAWLPAGDGPLVTATITAAGPARPGATVPVALSFAIAPGWHLYWENPGDSGLPPAIRWNLPPGWTADPLRFPVPERKVDAGLVSFSYHARVTLFTTLHCPPALPAGRHTIPAHVSWLVCQESCIPGAADLNLEVTVDPSATTPATPAAWNADLQRLPQPTPAGLTLLAQTSGNTATLTVRGIDLAPEATFFPLAEGGFSLAPSNTTWRATAGQITLPLSGQPPARLQGILTGVPGVAGVTVDLPWATAATPPAPGTSIGLATAVVAGLLGGLILNLMPCVLPVLALKLLSFTAHGGDRRRIIGAAGGYTLGVLATMAALAAVVLGLRATGAGIGWGFQLQEPVVVLLLLLLFVIVACNLAGMFEIGLSATRLDPRRGGNFANGVLTTLVATPCGAPFASTAFGFALVAPPVEAVLVFLALGLGLAAPVLAVALVPATARFLPKPGPWMADLKQVLALPLVGAAGWMAWTYSALVGAEAAFLVFVLLLPLVLGCAWAWGRWQQGRARSGWLVLVTIGMTLGLLAWIVTQPRSPAGVASPTAWQPWSAPRQAELTSQGTPMLIDATAAWCLTCQVNKRTSLHVPEVVAAAQSRGIALLQADFTRRDPTLAAELARHGRASVPTYLLIDRAGKATLLPDVLTPGILHAAFSTIPSGATP